MKQIQKNLLDSLTLRGFKAAIKQEDLDRLAGLAGGTAHSFLFEAAAEVGTELARYFFVLKNCPEFSCQACEVCKVAFYKAHPDFIVIAPEGTEIVRRQIVEEGLKFALEKPVMANRKVLVIEEAHLLNIEAGNALLKTVEEPPASTFFVFVTEKPEQLLPTILSRLTHVNFRSGIEQVKEKLVLNLLRNMVQYLVEKRSLHDLDLRIKEAVDGFAQKQTSFLEERIEFYRKVDFDPRLKKKLITLERQKHERLKRRYEYELLRLLFQKFKQLSWVVIEFYNGGRSFLELPSAEEEFCFEALRKLGAGKVEALAQVAEEALELLAREIKPEYVIRGIILKSWMVVAG